MGIEHAILKIRDQYFLWSTIVGAPVGRGMTLDRLRTHVQDNDGDIAVCILPERLKRVEKYGTSMKDVSVSSLVRNNCAGDNRKTLSIAGIYKKYSSPEEQPVEVWVHDPEHRVYARGRGIEVGVPIYREQWVLTGIKGSTTRSWITSTGRKLPKNGSTHWVRTKAEVEDRVWLHENGHRVASKVSDVCDPKVMRQIARLIGYQK